MESQSHIIQNQNSVTQPQGVSYEHNIGESWKAKLLKFVVRRILRLKSKTSVQDKINGKPDTSEVPEPPKNLMNKFDVTSWQVEGRNVFNLSPKQNKTQKHIIYLHGGSYVSNFVIYHWKFIEKLINEINCSVIAPDYPLAPTHTYVDSFKFIEPVYRKLISEVNPNDITIMGDSAGGGFALALAQKLKKDNLPQPGNIVLLSPWLDIRSNNPEMREIDPDDPMLTIESLQVAAEAYTKGGDINSELVCPIDGPLEGLGRISLFIGTHDILYADAKKFKSICDQKGVPINYYIYPQMMHDWMVMPLAEADHVIQQIKGLIG